MDFRLLGPVSAFVDGEELPLGGRKPRALLAMLLLRANAPVSRDALIDGLWGDRPPAAVDHTLDDYVSRLRRLVGADRLRRSPPGYVLRVDPGELDAERFASGLEMGSAALARGDAHAAAELLRSALAEWRGPALSDVLEAPFAAGAARDLEEHRLLAVERRLEADLARGGGRELVPELTSLVREQPFRERPVAQLMLAQYRSGDAAAALDTYSRARRRFVDELGLEPGPPLRLLERRILENDPGLLPPNAAHVDAEGDRQRRWSSRRPALAGVFVVLAMALVLAVAFVEHSGSPGLTAVAQQGVVGLGPDGSVERSIGLGAAPAALIAAHGSLWAVDADSQAVLRVDPRAGSVVDRVPLNGAPGALAAGGGSIWVATAQPGGVKRIDVATDDVTQTVPLGVNPSAIAYGADAVWVGDPSDQSLIELDPTTGAVRRAVTLTTRPSSIAVGMDAVWVASYVDGTVTQVDPHAGVSVAAPIPVGQGPSALVVAAGSVWVANELSGTVSRIDPQTARVVATIATGSGPTALAATDGSIWVADEYSRSVSRIDPRTGRVTVVRTGGGAPTSVAGLDGTIWTGTRSVLEHRGGRLVLLSQGLFSSMDPELEYEVFPPQLHGLAYDALVTFDHTGGANGLRLVPDLALALPTQSDAGRTYAFRLRAGIRYSDGAIVRAQDVRRAFERLYRVGSPVTSFFGGIAGASRCSMARCDLASGIVVDDRLRTVVFHLVRPDPEFLYKLAFVFTAPVPPGTPWHELRTHPFPGTGPYRIARATSTEVVLVRNRYFREWSHAAQPDGNPDSIVWRFGKSPADEVRAIEAGRADWTFDAVPAALLRDVATRHAGQFHANVAPETDFFIIDTRLRPFDDVRVRRAVNLAIDRRLIAQVYGGPAAATPTCQVLPPGVPGYVRYCPYTRDPAPSGRWRAPDLARARALVAAAGARGSRVEVLGFRDDPSITQNVVRAMAAALRELGFRTHIIWTTHAGYDSMSLELKQKIQLVPTGWFADYPSPADFFDVFVACKGTYNDGRFCDHALDRMMQTAAAAEAIDPNRAAALWSAVDRRTVDEAAWVPLVNPRVFDLVSRRVGNYQHNPLWGFLADQVWLR